MESELQPPTVPAPVGAGGGEEDVFGRVREVFDSPAWFLARNLAVFFAVVFWIATTYWVYKDARRRIGDPYLLAVAVALGAIPLAGPLAYLLFRPPEYLDDEYERDLELRLLERGLRDERCPVCRAIVETDFLVCPACTARLRTPCPTCERPLDPAWSICPYCVPAEQEPFPPLVDRLRVVAAGQNGDRPSETVPA